MSSIASGVMPTACGMRSSGSAPRLMSRMNARIAAIRRSTSATTSVSPAVKRFARYSMGIRSSSMAAKRLTAFSAS